MQTACEGGKRYGGMCEQLLGNGRLRAKDAMRRAGPRRLNAPRHEHKVQSFENNRYLTHFQTSQCEVDKTHQLVVLVQQFLGFTGLLGCRGERMFQV